MTLIEFFDKCPLENIIGSLALRPGRVIFLGSNRPKIEAALTAIRKICREQELHAIISYRMVAKNDITGVLTVLRDILSQDNALSREEEYVFDCSGGDEASLVAVGLAFRFTHSRLFRIQCETRRGVLYKIPAHASGEIVREPYDGTDKIYMTVAQNLLLHGGNLEEDMVSENASAGYPFRDSVYGDINRLWEICRRDCAAWNTQINRLSNALRSIDEEKSAFRLEEDSPGNSRLDDGFLHALTQTGSMMIADDGKHKTCTFRNPYMRDCLTKAGTLLEYKTYMTAFHYRHGAYPTPFTDGCPGVVIRWNDARNTSCNEIDVLLMQGVIPYFISCKNGDIKTDELYKLSTVAGRFGQKYAHRILVSTTYFEENRSESAAQSLRERAKEMNIRLIERVHRMDDRTFYEALTGEAHKLSEMRDWIV